MSTPELSPELLAALQAAVANGSINISALKDGRSPFRPRQLHDLTLLPTKDDPRPTFFWSAEKPRDGSGTKVSEFPKLMWSATGTEITVLSKDMQMQRQREGYQLHCPADVIVEQIDLVKAQWDQLSAADQEILTESYRQDRRNVLLKKMGAVDPAQIEAMLVAQEKQAKRKSA